MRWEQLLGWDARVSDCLRLSHEKSFWFRCAALLAHSGDSWFWLAGLLVVLLFGSPEWRLRSAILIIGMVTLAVIVLGIKFSVRRRRPEGEWGAIYRNTDPHSFPSGHASRAVALAVMAVVTGPAWFALLLIIWAPLVALARVITGLHYISDILAGMVIGLLMGLLMAAAYPYLVQYLPPLLELIP